MKILNKLSDREVLTISPSQWINILWIIFGVTLYFLYIPPIIALFKILQVYAWKYELTERYIVERKGLFNRSIRQVPYYRIRSVQMDQPLFLRIFGLSVIMIKTSDHYVSNMRIYAVPNGEELLGEINDVVEFWRQKENIKDVNLY